uniref:NADH dehydrogenase subunit 6 n=1 Tax=Squamanita imbachii TaxID=2976389 RepID=UPI0030DE234B
MKTLFLNLLAFGTLLQSVLTITSKNPVVSVIFLISTFVHAAGYLLVMGVNFIGLAYIVIYVGAIAVLFLFVIMMINIKLTDILETGTQYTKNLPLAIAIVTIFILIFSSILPFNSNLGFSPLEFINKFFRYSNLNYNSNNLNLFNHTNINSTFTSELPKNEINYSTNTPETLLIDLQQIEVLGHSLYTYDAILFITLSIILLLAMFAIITISLKNKN